MGDRGQAVEAAPDLLERGVREDRLGNHVVEHLAERLELELRCVGESRSLLPHEIRADLVADSLVDELSIGLDAAVPFRQEVWDQEASGAEGTAADVEQTMPFAETERGQQVELRSGHEVVRFFRTDVSAIVRHRERRLS